MSQDENPDHRPSILIVDDEPLMRLLLCEAVTESGYRALEAPDGLTALRMVQDAQPDAVLLDIVMPGMDGFATCAALRRLPQGENLPVVMITALETPETINRAYAAGATDYLPKPVNPSLLRHHLRYVLRASRLFDELRRTEKRLQLAGRVFTHSSEMILIADADYRIIEVNPAFCKLSGYRREEVIGSDLRSHRSTRHDDAFLRRLWQTVAETGHWQGELWNRRKDGESLLTLTTINRVDDQSGAPTHIVVTASDISRLRETEQRLLYLSRYDPLTDLPNRTLFLDRLQQALAHAHRRRGVLGVLCFDIDNFHEFNDTFGHAVGDRLLQMVAERIVSRVRKSDSVARLGSDQFALVLHDLDRDESVALVAQRIQELLAQPFIVEGRELDITTSIGIALYLRDGNDAEELCKKAEIAMQTAKREGKDRYCFFSDEMNSRTRERLALKHALRRGIERGEFLLYYQPKFDCRSGLLTGAEALVRWQHPERGLVPPLQFIPLAEETGLIVPLGEQVLRMACSQNRLWRERGFAPFRVAVNLSARQFHDEALLDMVAGMLAETGLEADGLELEITESAIMRDTARAAETLRRFRSMGIRLALDDFGTGYSSLGYLKRFPVDVIKIDYSFVKNIFVDPEDAAIVKAIIAMARSLNLTTVAEGVETEEQRTFLLEQGCDELQGYVAGMPQPADRIERFLPLAGPSSVAGDTRTRPPASVKHS
jgi:diguanylate cyclase (GGDEF)-like protein/PAS domain S-box-containing protein